MGREIRRVPRGWEHPRTSRGDYQPLYDQSYEDAAEAWLAGLTKWERGDDEDRQRHSDIRYYWDWAGMPPDLDYHRPAWTDEPTCYQIYETVSEGTPVSPVFETLDALTDWLVTQGYSRSAAEAFAKTGWAPSLVSVVTNGAVHVSTDIESLAYMPSKEQP